MAGFPEMVDEQQTEIARSDRALIWQKDRIAELEGTLEDSRRCQNRQTAPFSKSYHEENSAPRSPDVR